MSGNRYFDARKICVWAFVLILTVGSTAAGQAGTSARDLVSGSFTIVSVPDAIVWIDGVRYGSDGPILTSGGLRIPFGTVLQITAD